MKNIASKDKDTILEYMQTQEYVTANCAELKELLGNCHQRKVQRCLNYLSDIENIIAKDETSRPFKYKLKSKEYIVDTLSQKDGLDLSYALEVGSNEFSADTFKLIKRIFNANDSVSGHLASMEDLKNEQLLNHYNQLLEVIEQRYYVKLVFSLNKIYDEVKCIKLLFLDNNWYIAFEYTQLKNKYFKLGRLVFLKSIDKLCDNVYSNKNRFQKKEIKNYSNFLDTIQNSLTLYGVEPKRVMITILPQKAHYFKKGMKKFLKSQKFEREDEDGSVVISLLYTQTLEILPFIQQWIPYVEVEDGEVNDMLMENIKKYKMNLK